MFEIASILGTIAFALSGLLLGVRKELDWMGLFIVAMLTATGGGAVRDVLIDRVPNVFTDMAPFALVLGTVIIALAARIHRHTGLERRTFFVLSDSIGLIAFSITGALVGIEVGLPFFGVVVLAFLTATGGGILRDILLNEVPAVLSSGFYGSVALIMGALLYGLHLMEWLAPIWISATAAAGLVLRLIAHFRDWHLPKVKKGAPF